MNSGEYYCESQGMSHCVNRICYFPNKTLKTPGVNKVIVDTQHNNDLVNRPMDFDTAAQDTQLKEFRKSFK